MTTPDDPTAIRSVLVAFEDGTLGRDAMEAAVTMAAMLGAELEGIYLENDTLLRAAQLPFVQEVTSGSATLRPIDADSVQRFMQHSADLTRAILEQQAESAHVTCSFTVTRDRTIRRTLLTGSGSSQIVFFASRSHPLNVRPPMGMSLKSVSHPLLLVASAMPGEDRALQASAALAEHQPRPIVLLVVARDLESYRQLGLAASQTLCDRQLAHTLLPHPVSSATALVQTARQQYPGLLVLNRDCELMNERVLELLVEELSCPIVLV